MKHLNEFIKKNGYSLNNILTYNSYAVKGARDSHRDYDSISVTEILSLIIDPSWEIAKHYHSIAIKNSCEYGTKIHNKLERHIKHKEILDTENPILIQYKLALIIENIKPKLSEQTYSLSVGGIVPITGTIDLIGEINGVTSIIDFKTSIKNRNYISVKYKLQGIFYEILSGIKNFSCLYLNQKTYHLDSISDEERIYYTYIINDLLSYTVELFKKGKTNNLNLINKK